MCFKKKRKYLFVSHRVNNIKEKGRDFLFFPYILQLFQNLIPSYFPVCLLRTINPLPHMPILGSSNSTLNKDMMAKIWTNGDTVICLSRKHCGKRRNCSLRAISPFPTMFSKAGCY